MFLIDVADADDFTGGAETHVMDIIGHLNRTIFEPLCAADNRRFLERIASVNGVAVPTYLIRRRRGRAPLGYVFETARIIRRVKPHIMHTHKPRASIFGRIAGRLSGVPVIISTLHTAPSLQNPKGAKPFLYRRARYTLYKYANALTANHCCNMNIAVSRYEAQISTAKDGVSARKLRTIHNGIFDFHQWQNTPQQNPHGARLISIGRLHQEKGHIVALGAMERIKRIFPAATLTVVGSGPERSLLENFAGMKLAKGSINFLPTVDRGQIPSLLRDADLFVLPSYRESLPYTVIEAMASGLPVVATHVGGLPELIIPDRGGLLVPPGDPEALGSAVIELLRHPELRRAMGKFNRARAQALFNGDTMIKEIETLYLALVEQKTAYGIGQ